MSTTTRERVREGGDTGRDRRRPRAEAGRALRRLSAATTAGAVVGALLGGAGAQLAVALLAALDGDGATARDDAFLIGHAAGTGPLALLLIATAVGAFGGGVYLVLRHLLLGPGWVRVLTVGTATAAVVGVRVVDDVDLGLVQPRALGVAALVAVPFLAGALLAAVAEVLLDEDGWFARGPWWLTLVPLLNWVPLLLFFVPLALGWWVRGRLLRASWGRALLQSDASRWAARAVLGAVVVICAVALVAQLPGA